MYNVKRFNYYDDARYLNIVKTSSHDTSFTYQLRLFVPKMVIKYFHEFGTNFIRILTNSSYKLRFYRS